MSTTKTVDEFRVWVSTYGLYNAGALLGYWVAADEAPETVEEFKAGLDARGIAYARYVEEPWNEMGEELHCFDIECSPIDREMSPSEARAIAAVLEGIDDDRMPAFLGYAQQEKPGSAEALEQLAETFAEKFCGYHESVEDWAWDYLDDCGMLAELPEWAQQHRGGLVKSWANDAEHEGFSVCRDSDGERFVMAP